MALVRDHQRIKTRQQEWLWLAVLTASATACFEVWPQLDLTVSGWFFDQGIFQGSLWVWPKLAYHGTPILGALLIGAALLAVLPQLSFRPLWACWSTTA